MVGQRLEVTAQPQVPADLLSRRGVSPWRLHACMHTALGIWPEAGCDVKQVHSSVRAGFLAWDRSGFVRGGTGTDEIRPAPFTWPIMAALVCSLGACVRRALSLP